MQRYIGRIATFRANDRYGFIGIISVTKDDGSDHKLATTKDIFVHQDDCGSPLRPGMQVIFETTPDQNRGGDALRAVDVEHHFSHELILAGDEAGGSRKIADPRALYVPPTPSQRTLMKPVSPEEVDKVIANRPMPRVPRSSERLENATEVTNRLMQRLFPQFAAIHDGNMAEASFDDVIKQAIADHKALGMDAQASHMLGQANTYKGLRTLLKGEEDLLRPETLIPVQYLPDLFMAVPVWYFWADNQLQRQAQEIRNNPDPYVHAHLKYFCDLVPNRRWSDTFLMYNRRMRTLVDYKGDIIPPKIVARMRKMAELFDFLVIMTPYHDVAGQDWSNIQWMRSIDPYVIGVTKGIPLMFMLGRFSDSGTFPLYSELVADTIAFLRANKDKLAGFNQVQSPYWYEAGNVAANPCVQQLGTRLIRHTEELLAAFDAGNLFDWLRRESTVPARR